MDYNFYTINQEDTIAVFPSYFEYFTNLYGASLLTRVCRIAISNGRYDSKSLAAIDQAYGYTKDVISEAIKEGLKIIGIQDSDGKDIGYFRMRFITIEGVSLACVAEIVLPTEINADRIDTLKEMIRAIEEKVATNYLDVERLDFEAGASDYEMQTALTELGFHLLKGENEQAKVTCMYEKTLRQRNTTV